MPTLYLIDGYAQFFRAFHAIRTPMSSPVTKEPTNLTFGFVGMLLKLLRGEGKMGGRPDYVVVAIDVSGDKETFRSELYPEYKANRPPPPEGLPVQVERCLAMLRSAGVPVVGVEGFEADDTIATLVTRLRRERPDLTIRIVSKDKDLKQLLEEGAEGRRDEGAEGNAGGVRGGAVEMYDVHTDELITAGSFRGETGLEPRQVVDMLALMGDSVDNVPGVEGVGPKTAAELVGKYGTLDNLLAHAAEVKGKRGEALRASAELLALSRQLVTLRHDAPVALDLHEAEVTRFRLGELIPILRELGFNRYQDDVRALMGGERVGGAGGKGAAESGGATETSAGTLLAAGATPGAAKPARRGASASKGAGSSGSQGGLFDALAASAPGEAEHAAPAGSSIAAGAATRGRYRCVRTEADLRELVAELTAAAIFAVDTETTGLSPLLDRLCGLSFSTRAGTGWYVPVRSPTPEQHLSEAAVLGALKPLLEDAGRPKCGHNLKFDLLVLRTAGIELRGLARPVDAARGDGASAAAPAPSGFDSMVASYLIDASRSSHGLDALALSLLGHTNISIKELIGSGAEQRTFDTVPLDLATEYAAEDADVSFRLYEAMLPQVRAMGLSSLLEEVELPLVEVLAELEWNGIAVDAAELDRQRARLQSRIDDLRAKIDAAAKEALGRTFNPDSPKQLAGALFNKPGDEPEPGLGLKVVKRTKTGASTDIEVLETLAQDASVTTPIPQLIVDYRQLTKLVSTYLVALKEAINPKTGRIHASFHQTVAATGRLASSDPNLQNIPIRTDVGREIRRAFVAPPGRVLLSADYSQIELRLLAHLSGDENLRRAFLDDQDIHTAVAAQINRVPAAEVTREQRSGAKMVNFGIVYGITPFGLARRLGCSNAEAEEIITSYKRRFAGITTFLQECVEQARRHGYVETMLKRRRPIPEIESSNPSRRAFAERTAINSVVQGSAADLIKLAMIDLHARLSEHAGHHRAGMPPRLHGVRMLLQIHDELVFECPAETAKRAQELVVDRMVSAMTLSVPLKVDSSVATNWFEGK